MDGNEIYYNEVICFDIRLRLCKSTCFIFNLFKAQCFANLYSDNINISTILDTTKCISFAH